MSQPSNDGTVRLPVGNSTNAKNIWTSPLRLHGATVAPPRRPRRHRGATAAPPRRHRDATAAQPLELYIKMFPAPPEKNEHID